MLEPGTYVLHKDVTNPKPDRRQRYDWRAHQVFKAGTEFLAVDWLGEVPKDVRTDLVGPHTELRMVGHRWSHHAVRAGRGQYAALYAALEAALVPAQESLSAMLTRLDVHSQFGRWLLESGSLSREVFETLWAQYMAGGEGIPLHPARRS